MNIPPNIPDLRKPSAPKRVAWAMNEVANTVVHGLLVQVAVSLEGVVIFAGGRPLNRVVRVAEDGPEAVVFEDHIQGGAARITLQQGEEVCRTAKMSTELWRGDLDLGEQAGRAWERHMTMWREAHPLVVAVDLA